MFFFVDLDKYPVQAIGFCRHYPCEADFSYYLNIHLFFGFLIPL